LLYCCCCFSSFSGTSLTYAFISVLTWFMSPDTFSRFRFLLRFYNRQGKIFSSVKSMLFTFRSGVWLYNGSYLSSRVESHYQTVHQKPRALIGSTVGVIWRLRSDIQTGMDANKRLGVIWGRAVYMNPYTLSMICVTNITFVKL